MLKRSARAAVRLGLGRPRVRRLVESELGRTRRSVPATATGPSGAFVDLQGVSHPLDPALRDRLKPGWRTMTGSRRGGHAAERRLAPAESRGGCARPRWRKRRRSSARRPGVGSRAGSSRSAATTARSPSSSRRSGGARVDWPRTSRGTTWPSARRARRGRDRCPAWRARRASRAGAGRRRVARRRRGVRRGRHHGIDARARRASMRSSRSRSWSTCDARRRLRLDGPPAQARWHRPITTTTRSSALNGGPALCTLDFPWGHARLDAADFERYCREVRPERSRPGAPLLPREPQPDDPGGPAGRARERPAWRSSPSSRGPIGRLVPRSPRRPRRGPAVVPDVTIDDLLATFVTVVARRPG